MGASPSISPFLQRPVETDAHIPLLCYPHLSRYTHIAHGIFTRAGGISDPPYDALNLSYSVGDRPNAVKANLSAIQTALDARHLIYLNQIHSDTVLVLKRRHLGRNWTPPFADAVITDLPQVAILIKQADCQSVILYDPHTAVVANVHCGWRGNVKNILGKAVRCMTLAFGADPHHMVAAIGPSLGPCCAEFIGFEKYFPIHFKDFMVKPDHFDLWSLSRYQLIDAGLRHKNIACAHLCTRCRTDLFYSYRGKGTTGRFGTVVMLNHRARGN